MPGDSDKKNVPRRAFLDTLLQGTVVCGVLGMAYPIVGFVIPPKGTQGAEQEVEAGSANELGPGKAKKFEFNGKPALLINTKTGYAALSAVCSHLGCIVEWDENKKQVVCPCHNAVFDYNGNIVSGPPPLPLDKLEATVRGDKIMVRKKG